MEAVLKVKKVHVDLCPYSSEEVEDLFSSAEWQDIAHCPWANEFPYKPYVRFQILHSDRMIYLRYEVQEEYVKAQYIRPNENIWEDSCVEFFISLDNRQTYYNLEFNVLGTGVIGYGPAVRAERHRLDVAVVEQVDTFTQVAKKNGDKQWTIVLSVPKNMLNQEFGSGFEAYANFYKCGDGLPRPHFLAWSDIKNSPKPNFHQPQFFGKLIFE